MENKAGNLLVGFKEIIDKISISGEEKAEVTIEFQELLYQHEQSILQAQIADRDSARNREIETVKVGSRNTTQNFLAYIGVISFFAITGYVLYHGLGNMNTEEGFIIGNLIGMAGSISKDIFGYYFGSSKGEHDNRKSVKINHNI